MGIEDLLRNIPDKSTDKNTTTYCFKEDLADFIREEGVRSVLEIGSSKGYTTYILANLVSKVTSVDKEPDKLASAAVLNRRKDNITYIADDVYVSDWSKYGVHDLVIIDCIHTYDNVRLDISNSIMRINPKYLVFDDFGTFEGVRLAVEEAISEGKLKILRRIGYPSGSIFGNLTSGRKVLEESEGVICENLNYVK